MTHGLEQVAAIFDGADHPRAIGGGWALDLHLGEPGHQIWARPDPGSDWAFEVLFEDVRDGIWRYRRNPAVPLPEEDLITTIGSIPTFHLGVSLLSRRSGMTIWISRTWKRASRSSETKIAFGSARRWLRLMAPITGG